jgi:RNA polymerase sigma factor (sigma-70 family)
LDDLSDYELMQQIGAGRAELLAVLYDKYQRRLFNFFLKLGHARSASEDLVHDTFLRVLRHAASYKGDGHFVGWLFRVARNVAVDSWHQNAAMEPLAEEQEAMLPAHADHDPANMHEQAQLELRLQRALLQLPRESRELVLLSRVTELSTEELAQLFGCSAGAVKVRLHRALLQLRQYFDASGECVKHGGGVNKTSTRKQP